MTINPDNIPAYLGIPKDEAEYQGDKPLHFPESHPTLGVPNKIYAYRNERGNALSAVYRFDTPNGKEIRPYDAINQGWAFPEQRTLYNLDYVERSSLTGNNHQPVILVEGEKCADALLKLGFLAVTTMGGSNGAHLSDWTPLKGRRTVIWPDNDHAGLK